MPMVYTPVGAALERVSRPAEARAGARLRRHGIGRVGVPHAQAAALIRDLAARNPCVSTA